MATGSSSPLRYPGGKASLGQVLLSIIKANDLQGCTYVEAFAGGAGAGIKLLREGHVDRIIINDRDRAVFCFWNSIMRRTEDFVRKVLSAPLTLREWHRQRELYRSPGRCSQLDLGFAAFYLNRCNRSGIIMNGGPIGGISQSGKWKIDARFNRSELASRIEDLASYGDRIVVLREDGAELIRNIKSHVSDEACFLYADPPYYVKGRGLYFSHFEDRDHLALAKLMRNRSKIAWVMTYDDVPRVRQLYGEMNLTPFKLRYSAHLSSIEGGEVLISPDHVRLPAEVHRLLASRARGAGSIARA